MTRVMWVTKWVYDETYEYNFDSPLPDNWDTMTNKERLQFLEQFDCEIVNTQPVAPYDEVGTFDYFEVYE